MKANWGKATEHTKDCFNKWGIYDHEAILECKMLDHNGVKYDLTILKSGKTYIPAHGSIHMIPCKTLKVAKANAIDWFYAETSQLKSR